MRRAPGTLALMRRLVKVIGLVGGIAALVWAIRDRFISVAISREPEPPTFRRHRAASSDVDQIDGIGPVFASRLAAAGLGTIASLASATPDSVSEAAGVSVARARSWIEQARQQS